MDSVISVKNLKSYYVSSIFGKKITVKAVNDVTFDILSDEIVGIAGESGCGKTTLLNVLLGIVEPPLRVFDGEVLYSLGKNGDIDILRLDEEKKLQLRWQVVSYIPQGSMNILNPIRKIKKIFFDFAKSKKNLNKKNLSFF